MRQWPTEICSVLSFINIWYKRMHFFEAQSLDNSSWDGYQCRVFEQVSHMIVGEKWNRIKHDGVEPILIILCLFIYVLA